MANLTTLLLFLLVLCHGVLATTNGHHEGDEEDRPSRSSTSSSSKLFLMHDSKRVIKTDAGEMRVLKSHSGTGRINDRHMHIGFITMEPKSLFIPHYLDSNFIIFIRRGEAKLGFIYDDELAERRLKTGDVYVIPAGTAFYLVNTGEGQRLHIICSIDPSTNSGEHIFQSFLIGGGANSQSVLSGFEPAILEAAFNESRTLVEKILGKELDPIVYVGDAHAPSLWTKFLQLKREEKVQHLKNMVHDKEEEKETSWSWRKLLANVLGMVNNKKPEKKDSAGSPDSYNLYDKKPDFQNAYGWSKALDGDQYHPLREVDIGIFHVNLTAGSMMAPHVNPRAKEYGIVLRGHGEIQIVFPNGTNAMKSEIREGDVFVVPRYFPFCQIASRNGALEFFGFSTSARENKPQFLVGAASLLRTMLSPELAAALGVSLDRLRRVAYAQPEALMMPSTWAAPPHSYAF
ncbi:hypothetical protein RJT34_29925 [Clitoria ternatea]|uniref:Cupin type-1 domain-containing protein n=1 Tax=Clitoria ternatea TaxID=43366 RepID=A0AAN9ES56_CLITE